MTEQMQPERLKTRRYPTPVLLDQSNGEGSPPGQEAPSTSARPIQPCWNATSISRVIDGRAWVEVDLGAILHNARAICAAAGGAKLLAVVKANAYGLGAAQIAKTLEGVNPWGFAVATIDEGIALRDAGILRPILVLRPARAGMRDHYHHYRLRPVVEDPETLAGWETAFHVEIDTGMGRTGIRWDATRLLEEIGERRPEGVFTHLHSADESPESVGVQWGRFQTALSAMHYRPPLLHVANSAGVWRVPKPVDLFRPGIFLYGGKVGPKLPLPRPVVTLKAEVISVRAIRRGESISYGAQWRADHDTRIATLGVGYADGLPRSLPGSGYALINGRRHPFVGRVTMDMTMVDAGPDDHGALQLGDTAVLIGRDGSKEILLDEFAAWSQTISYEVLTSLGARLPRVYVTD